jgi:hypothetical protein
MSALGGMSVHAMSFAGSDILPTANPAGTSMWLEESNQYGQTPTNWMSHPSGIGYRRSSPGITTWSGSGSGSTSSTGAAIPGNPVTMDTGMSDAGNQDEINRLNNFITGGNENPTAMQPGPISRGEQEGGGGPLRSNLGNEMNVGGYVGYGLLQQFGLIPEQSDRSSGDPNHVDSSRSGTGGRNYGNGVSYSPPVESAPPAEPGPAGDQPGTQGANSDGPSMGAAPPESALAGMWKDFWFGLNEFFTRDAAVESQEATDSFSKAGILQRNTVANKLYHHVVKQGSSVVNGTMMTIRHPEPLVDSVLDEIELIATDPAAANDSAIGGATAIANWYNGASDWEKKDAATKIFASLLLSGGASKLAEGVGAAAANRARFLELARDMQGGGSYLMTKAQFEQLAEGKTLLGRLEGQFMTSARLMNRIIQETGGDPVLLGQKLGMPRWGPGTQLIRMDVTDPLSFNPRMPNASMSGANSLFRNGGLTSGGVPELVTDQLPSHQVWSMPLRRP